MKKSNQIKIWLLLILLLVSTISTTIVSSENILSTDIDGLSYKQEIIIPIDTSLSVSKFQPIDIRIDFENSCWAEDENTHSVRIGIEKDGGLTEIDSQIYDLEYDDNSHINSCSIVFLIPEDADGSEKYYVYYDSAKTNGPDYEDHITIEDTHYFYEPISGQTIFFDYYGIRQDEDVIYAIVQTGELLGNPVSFAAAKFKPNSKVVETYNIDQLVDFDLRYGIEEEPGYVGTSWATEVKKTVLVDGNIMVRVRLEGVSTRGDIKTDNIYTYYYSPTDIKRMMVKCHHEILEDINIDEPSTLDGTLSGITSIKSRSATIEKMNVGEILPDLIVYDEDESIKEYSVPLNPTSSERELVLSTEDDIDLGSHAWACLSEKSSGRCHGIIFESNTGFDDENDGIQIKAYTKQNIDLPGLEADTGNIYLTRNAYENGKHDTTLEKDETFDYNTIYVCVEKEGYQRVDLESEIFQTLIKEVPIFRENATEGEVVEEERFTLSTSVHFAPSFPLGSLLSAYKGKNYPYIYAELYKDNNFKSSGSVSRISLGSIDLDLEGKNILQTIKTVIGLFDWKNASFFKKIEFPDLVEGRYLVKIFRENPIFGGDRKYIGYDIIDLNKDSDISIICHPEGKLDTTVKDQNDNGIRDVKFQLLKNDDIIFESTSDENGTASLKAPIYLREPYTLRVQYKGFIIDEKNVKLGVLQSIRSATENFKIDLFNLEIKIKDKWYLTPEVDVNPKITSNEMYELNTIKSEKINFGKYVFKNLPVSKYCLTIKYKSFETVKNVDVSSDSTVDIVFPAEYETELSVYNDMGEKIDDYEIKISRKNKKEKMNSNGDDSTSFVVPPGIYEIEIESDNDIIASQKIDVKSDKTIDIVSTEESGFHGTIVILGIIVFIIGIIYLIWKREHSIPIRIFVISLLIISVVSPWWMLSGENNSTETITKTMLVPSKIISITESDNAVGGSISSIPEELTMILGLLSILLILSALIIFISIFTKDRLNKTTKGLLVGSVIIIILTLGLFYLAMSMVAEVGVGSVVGSGEIETTIPGISEKMMIECSWGPSTGFYLGIISLIMILLIPIINRFRK